MRTALSAVVVLALVLGGCTGCSTTLEKIWTGPKPPDLDGVRPVTSKVGVGHVCAVGPRYALTAGHVESWRGVLGSPLQTHPVPLMGELNGAPLTLFRIWSDMRRDLSMVGIAGPEEFPRYYPLAKTIPNPGAKLWIRGFMVYKGFEGTPVQVEVLRIEFGHIFLKEASSGYMGSSGSCMLNEDEEVVGIYTAAYPQRNDAGKVTWMGDGELVAGIWGTFHESFIEKGVLPR